MRIPGKTLFCALLLAMPGLALAGGLGCDKVVFGDEVNAKFPNAKKACVDVLEKDGGIYVKFVADVVSVDKDNVTVEFLDKQDKAVSRVTFAPEPGQTVKVNGKEVLYSKLEKGTKLHFYIEHSKWGLWAKPTGTSMKIVSSEAL